MELIKKVGILFVIAVLCLTNVLFMNVSTVKAAEPEKGNVTCTKIWGNSTGRTGSNATTWGNSDTSTGCSGIFGNSICIRMQCKYCCR